MTVVPTYVAFLRAINLGATRKFPKGDIARVVSSTGATGVETHINTGNVRLTSTRRSRERLAEELEAAFAADRGFAVPTVVFTLAEVAELAAATERVAAAHGAPDRHYLTLLQTSPTAALEAELAALARTTRPTGELAELHGRAVHLVLTEAAYHSARLGNARIERLMGVATTRDAKVIRAIAAKWC